MRVAEGSIVAMRDVAMGLGDRMLCVMAGIGAALFFFHLGCRRCAHGRGD
jgi:hypothetical protein